MEPQLRLNRTRLNVEDIRVVLVPFVLNWFGREVGVLLHLLFHCFPIRSR